MLYILIPRNEKTDCTARTETTKVRAKHAELDSDIEDFLAFNDVTVVLLWSSEVKVTQCHVIKILPEPTKFGFILLHFTLNMFET